MREYDKDFLVSAFCSRYVSVLLHDQQLQQLEMAEKLYDEVGKEKFRVYASLDATAIKAYKESLQ